MLYCVIGVFVIIIFTTCVMIAEFSNAQQQNTKRVKATIRSLPVMSFGARLQAGGRGGRCMDYDEARREAAALLVTRVFALEIRKLLEIL